MRLRSISVFSINSLISSSSPTGCFFIALFIPGIDFSTTTGNVKKNPCTMDKSIIFIISFLSVAVLVLSALVITMGFKLRNARFSMQMFENLSMLCPNGERVVLTYKVIEEMHRQYFKNLRNKNNISEFEKKIVSYVLDDVGEIKNYNQLRQYMHLNQQETYPFLEKLHRTVLLQHGAYIQQLFVMEEMHITGLKDHLQLNGVTGFLEELSSAYFKGVPIITPVYERMELFQETCMHIEHDVMVIPVIMAELEKEDKRRFPTKQ